MSVVGIQRRHLDVTTGAKTATVGDLGADTDWYDILAGVDVVIHCAAQSSVTSCDRRDAYRGLQEVNVHATRRLAEQAVSAGVKRLVFISSVKVHGESTQRGERLTIGVDSLSGGIPQNPPMESYARSKWDAELALRDVALETGLDVVVVRPPLVYGPGVKGNFLQLMKLVASRVPLPLGGIDNRRSLVALSNLADLICECAINPDAAGRSFLVSDGHDLSTPELLLLLGRAMGLRVTLLPAPTRLLRRFSSWAGKGQNLERLIGSLQVDIDSTAQTLGWRPRVSVESAIQETVDWFRVQS